jgi:hypothetical protein
MIGGVDTGYNSTTVRGTPANTTNYITVTGSRMIFANTNNPIEICISNANSGGGIVVSSMFLYLEDPVARIL